MPQIRVANTLTDFLATRADWDNLPSHVPATGVKSQAILAT